jgi:hypothetical protein
MCVGFKQQRKHREEVMNVKLLHYSPKGASDYEVRDKVVCTLNGAEVEVRQSTDGTCLIVAIKNGRDNKVHMESRAAAIWLVVKPAEGHDV